MLDLTDSDTNSHSTLDLSPSSTDTETDVDVYSVSTPDEMEVDSDDPRTGPDLLDRLVDGLRHAGGGAREGEQDGELTKGWGGDSDGDVNEEDVVSEAMLLL